MANRDIPTRSELTEMYPSNSYASRQERNDSEESKEIKRVTSGKVRKHGIFRRLGKSLIEDSIENAKEKAFGEIVVPGFKTLIFDTLTEILNISLFGADSGRYRSRANPGLPSRSRASYSDFYDRRDRRDRTNYGSVIETASIPYDPNDIIVNTREEAKAVLDEVDLTIRKYGQASVADFYDIVGVTSDWTDNRYGWTDIRGAGIKPVRDGFMILMPRTHVLEN